MNRITSILPLSFAVLTLATFITVVIDNYVEVPLVSLQTFSNIVTVVSSVVLLTISVKLYQKFSGTQSIIDKQTALVVELIVLLSESKFELKQVRRNNKNGNALVNISLHGYQTHLKRGQGLIPQSDYSQKKLYINAGILKFLEHFWKLKDNPYLPRDIALLLRNDFEMMTQAIFPKNELKEEYLEFNAMFYAASDSLLWQSSDINKIMKSIKNAYIECDKWLKAHNREAYESLNLISDRMPSIRD